MSPTAKRPGWFEVPKTQLSADRSGTVRSAFIRFRDAKMVRIEQPDLDYPVFIYVGSDDLPVGIKFTAPISGEIEVRFRYYLKADAQGEPLGVERRVAYSFKPIPSALVEPTLRQAAQASRALQHSG